MNDLSTEILLQIQSEQVKMAHVLGGVAESIRFSAQAHQDNKLEIIESKRRITALERSGLRQTGFIAGAVFAADFIAKKLRIL